MRCVAVVCMFVVFAFVCRAGADEVIFKNGDRLTGTVVGLADGQLKMDSWSAGTVTVEIAKVRTLTTEAPIEIHFRDGTVVTQRVFSSDEGRFAIERQGVLEPQVFAITDVTAINPAPPPKPRWTGDVTAGVTITRSNTDTDNANVSVKLVRSGEVDRITVNAAMLYGRQEDPATGERRTTEDSWSGDAKYDYFVSERMFVYANSGVEKDEILDLDLRLLVGGGVGREWFERDAFSFQTEAGLAWHYEDFANGTETTDQITGRLAYHLAKRFNDIVALTHDVAWYPALDDMGDYLLTAEVDVRVSLTETMFGSFKLLFDYDSTPAASADNSSFKSILGLGMSF